MNIKNNFVFVQYTMHKKQEYDGSFTPELGILFAKYYLVVKKQKRDIEYYKEFDEMELHDLQYTILLLLNHIGTNDNQEPLSSDEIVEKLVDSHIETSEVSQPIEDKVETVSTEQQTD